MKAVMISIQPKWVEKIASGEKTIEVRKTAPKEVPFKCYIYCTYGNMKENYCLGMRGKVIGEFICDKVYMSFVGYRKNEPCYWDILNGSCLTKDEIMNYGKWKTLYGWHISDLKIYDKPKELSEFYTKKKCNSCKKSGYESTACMYDEDCKVPMSITRPPQSWCYVEDLGEEK